jgi:hypothetical protein
MSQASQSMLVMGPLRAYRPLSSLLVALLGLLLAILAFSLRAAGHPTWVQGVGAVVVYVPLQAFIWWLTTARIGLEECQMVWRPEGHLPQTVVLPYSEIERVESRLDAGEIWVVTKQGTVVTMGPFLALKFWKLPDRLRTAVNAVQERAASARGPSDTAVEARVP